MRIIPESERKLMTSKEVDFEFDGCEVLFDCMDFYPKDLGYVVAVSDGTREDLENLHDLGQELFKGRCWIVPAIKKRHTSEWVEEIYWN